MKKPIIGIMLRTDTLINNRSIQYVFDETRRAIIRSGGEVLLLCPPKDLDYFKTPWKDFPEITDEDIESIEYFLKMCDGLVLPGGIKYTKYDLFVLDWAIKKNMPVLGFCLGMQIMSNYQNDFKIEDIDSVINHYSPNLDYCHKVKINKNSLLYKILEKEEISVNSLHKKQAFLNPLFKEVAFSEDGILEAIELPTNSFVLGVQWHPEKMLGYDEDQQKILNYFINEAIKYKNIHKKGRLVKL